MKDAIGMGGLRLNKNGDALETQDNPIFEREEYSALRADMLGTIWTKATPRIVKENLTIRELEAGIQAWMQHNQFVGELGKRYYDLGALALGKNAIFSPFEIILNYFRGIKGASLDVRKCKGELKDTLDFLWETMCAPTLQKALQNKDFDGFIAPLKSLCLAHSVLSVKQFGELYWPYMKKIFDFVEEHDMRISIFCESEMLRFAEFFEEIPKGRAMIVLELDDIVQMRKRLPNLALSGGLPVHLLGRGTPQECVDYVKRIVDTVGDGLAISSDKALCTKMDAKRENLLAVQEFLYTYSG